MAKVSSDITESYVSEVKELLEESRKDIMTLKNSQDDPETLSRLLRNLHTIKGNSRMLGFSTIEKLAHAVEDIYKSVKDGNIKNSERLVKLVFAVTNKIEDCVISVSRKGNDEQNIELYLQYCDKLAAGELIDIESFIKELNRERGELLLDEDEEEDADNVNDIQSIRIKLARVNEIITSFDTMITREFHLKHQLDELHKFEEKIGSHELSKIRKQFESDIYALETSIFSVQEQVFDLRMLPISIVLRPLESTIAMEAMNLKKKVDAGASHLLSQLFFDNDQFYRFLERCQIKGINVPIEAGIMPATNKKSIERMVSMTNAVLPKKFTDMMDRYADHPDAIRDAGIAYAIDQIVDLVTHGVSGIHLYTMNNPHVARKIYEATKSLFDVSPLTSRV